MCRARGCTERHARHYCSFCENTNSTHLSSECPERHRAILYHGTSTDKSALLSMLVVGDFNPSSTGRLGPGFYFARTKEVAQRIAAHRMTPDAKASFNMTTALMYQVDLGRVCNRRGNSDQPGRWVQEGFDSCTGTHPPWADNREFREYVVRDKSRMQFLGLVLRTSDGHEIDVDKRRAGRGTYRILDPRGRVMFQTNDPSDFLNDPQGSRAFNQATSRI